MKISRLSTFRSVAMVGMMLLLIGPALCAKGTRAAATGGPEDFDSEAPRIVVPDTEAFSATELRRIASRELEGVGAGDGGPADLADAAYAMENALRRVGYPEAIVTFSMFQSDGNREIQSAAGWDRVDKVRFSIDMGHKAIFASLGFEGVSEFDEERLRPFFPRPTDSPEGPPFYRRRIENALQEVTRLYELAGYVEVSVDPLEIARREGQGVVFYDVVVPVKEGPRYTIAVVDIESPDLTNEDLFDLRRQISLQGQPFYPRQAAEGAVRIRNVLGRKGFRATVDYEVELLSDGDSQGAPRATIAYTVVAGPRLIVRDVKIEARNQEALRTRQGFVRSFVPLQSGDTLDLGALGKAKDRLYSLGVFALVEVEPRVLEGAPTGGTVETVPADVVVGLTEVKSREVELSAGWGSYELATGSVTFSDRNIFGLGRFWATTVYGSFKTYGAESTISDGILLGPRSTLSLTGSYAFRDAPAYDITTVESRVDVVIRLNAPWRVEGAYSIGFERIAEAVEEEEVPVVTDYRAARITAGAVRDARNSAVLPTQGSEMGVRGQYSSPAIGSELNYADGSFFGEYHQEISARVVASTAGRVRTRLPLGRETTLPIQERLFLGGSTSVRSFALDQLGPVGESGDVIGGLTSLEGTAEVRVRIVDSFYGAAFYDVGVVARDELSLEGTVGQGIGGGLRYYLPIGPIRVDVAYNPGDLVKSDRRWAIHLAVGFSY